MPLGVQCKMLQNEGERNETRSQKEQDRETEEGRVKKRRQKTLESKGMKNATATNDLHTIYELRASLSIAVPFVS